MGILQSGSEHCRPDEEGSRADITAEHGSAQGKGRVGAVDVATEAEGTVGPGVRVSQHGWVQDGPWGNSGRRVPGCSHSPVMGDCLRLPPGAGTPLCPALT